MRNKNTSKKSLRAFLLATVILSTVVFFGCTKDVSDYSLNLSIDNGFTIVTYTGILKGKKPEGKGTATISSVSGEFEYVGEFAEGLPTLGKVTDMHATVSARDVDYTGTYSGEVNGLVLSGNGEFISDDKQILSVKYNGSFSEGLPYAGNLTLLDGENILFVDTYKDGEVIDVEATNFSFELEYEGEKLNGLY